MVESIQPAFILEQGERKAEKKMTIERPMHYVRCMHAVVWEVHGYYFEISVFYKEKKVPNPLEASTEGLKSAVFWEIVK